MLDSKKDNAPRPANWRQQLMLQKGISPTVKQDPEEWEKRQGRRSKTPQNLSQKGTILTFFLFLTTLVIGSFWYFTQHQAIAASPKTPPQGTPDFNSHQKLTVPESTLYDIPPLVVAKNFALTSDIEERLKWARHPEEVRKRLSQYPLQAREGIAHQITPLGEITTGTQHYLTFLVDFPDGGQRLLCVIGTPDGPRVDWDTYARYGTASWNDILSGKSKEATVRVFSALSDYYVQEFSDREKWICVTLSSPDLKIPIYGYIDRTSELAQDIGRFRASRAVLDIRMTPNQIKNRLVEITGLRGMGWVE